MVITKKKDGTARRTINPQKLNSQTARETHHCESPFHLASQIPPYTKKTVINAVDGYHVVLLDQESQKLTIFITELGRYMNLQIPQAFKAAGDIYLKDMTASLKTFPTKRK